MNTLDTKGRQYDNFVFIGGTVSCRNENLWWRQTCQIDDLYFSKIEVQAIFDLLSLQLCNSCS